MNGVTVAFSKLFSDRFQYSDHIADLSVRVFQPHVDDTAVVRDSVKGRMYFYPASSKNFPDIPGKDYIGASVFWYFVNDFIKSFPDRRTIENSDLCANSPKKL